MSRRANRPERPLVDGGCTTIATMKKGYGFSVYFRLRHYLIGNL